jgi:hypothetical protein
MQQRCLAVAGRRCRLRIRPPDDLEARLLTGMYCS